MQWRTRLESLGRRLELVAEPPLGIGRVIVLTRVEAGGDALERTLRSVAAQDYPVALLEHRVAGGDGVHDVETVIARVRRDHPKRQISQRPLDVPPAIGMAVLELEEGAALEDPRAIEWFNADTQDTDPTGPRRSSSLVSIVMPAFNEEKYIEEALDCSLGQTYREVELIVVDDGSTDRTPEILAKRAALDPRMRVIRQENSGVAAALNLGMSAANGHYVARMDANDRMALHRIEVQVRYLERFGDIGVVGTWMESIRPDGEPTGRTWKTPTLPGPVAWGLHFSSAMVHASILARRSVLEHVGYYRTSDVEHFEDYDLWARLLPSTRMATIPETLYVRRELPTGVTFAHEREQAKGARDIVRRLLGRTLQRSVSEAEADLVFRARRGGALDEPRLAEARSLLDELHRRFRQSCEMSPIERDIVDLDLARTLSRLAIAASARHPVVGAGLLSEAVAINPIVFCARAGELAIQRWRSRRTRR